MRNFNDLDPSIKSSAIMTAMYADETGMTPQEMDSIWSMGIAAAIRERQRNPTQHPWLAKASALCAPAAVAVAAPSP